MERIPFDIYIVGTGMVPAYHLTLEAVQVLSRSKRVFYVDKSFGIEEVLSQYCADVVDLHKLCYVEGQSRLDAYRQMASLVLDAALEEGPVSFALYGHPLIYSFPPFIVIAAAEAMGLRVKVLPGVSSLDTLFVDLRVDPCTNGIQMYEATDLLLRERPIQPDVPCIIWQIGTVESRLYSEHGSAPGRFGRIKEYLLRYYPDSANLIAVHCASAPIVPPKIVEFMLKDIDDHAESLHQGVTVYIPPVEMRGVTNEALLVEMDEGDHLRRLTINRT